LLVQVGDPDLDERPDRVLDPRLAGERERLLPALPRLGGIHALFETVVSGYEKLLDPRTQIILGHEESHY
jgi:hypothetical protein